MTPMATPSESGITIAIESPGADSGVEIIDPIERRRCVLRTPGPVSPTATDPEVFRFPVETAVEIETSAITLPTTEHVYVRDQEGGMLAEVKHGERATFPADAYSLEPNALVKIYLRVESPVEVRTDGGQTELSFDDSTTVLVGSRSSHERPATTVTTTADPADVLAAISTFGSALKTTSPERSFPTLRGHPPAVTLGDELSIPDGLEPPVDDVRIEVPPEYRYAYPTVPLSYYLGVPVEPGAEPRIVGDGIDYELEEGRAFQQHVGRVLQRTFLLDCVTRTEGLYKVDLHERRVVERRLDIAFKELYDASPAERLRQYLDVPHGTIADVTPDWQLATHVDAEPSTVEALPYLADDLALVRVAEPNPVSPSFLETGETQGLVRGTTAADATFVQPAERADAIEEAWIGEGMPLAATKAMTEAYRNRIGRNPSTGSIDISVVCNAGEMTDERDVVDEVYGSREDLPFDVTVYGDVTTEELADLLATPQDFLHYVGHIDETGIRCADGRLDVSTVDDVAVDAFFLNACRSYDPGMDLVRAGAIGGIVTLSDVVNHGAVRIGRAVARLLNCGFPLRATLDIARDESVIGSQYIVVGDGGLSIVQPEGGTPLLCRVDNGENLAVRLDAFGAAPGMGCMYVPFLGDNERHYLGSGSTEELAIEPTELVEFLWLENYPVRIDGTLSWGNELTVDDFANART